MGCEEQSEDSSRIKTESFQEFSPNAAENTYLNAAKRLDIPFRAISGEKKFWMLGESPGVLLSKAVLGVNPATLHRLTSDKAATQLLLSEHGIPVPEFLHHNITDDWKACLDKFARFSSSRYPVVIKPNSESQAANVYTDIRSAGEISRVLVRLGTQPIKSLMLEKHVPGNTYRGIILDGELIDVVQWQLSTIVGDGRSSVESLLIALNETHPEFREIVFGDRLLEILAKHELDLSSVLEEARRIKVVDAGVSRGASRHRIPLDSVPGQTMKLLGGIGSLLGARLIGVDFICEEVAIPWTDQEFAINEVNSSPGFGLHYPGTTDHDLDTAKQILTRLSITT